MEKTEKQVEKLLITASGGPFRGRKREELEHVTACRYPEASELGNGTEDHSRFCNPGQ